MSPEHADLQRKRAPAMTPLLLASPWCEICKADLLQSGALLCHACNALRSAPQPAACAICGTRLACVACGCQVTPTHGRIVRPTPFLDAERRRMNEARADMLAGAIAPWLWVVVAVSLAAAWWLRWADPGIAGH